LGCLSLRTLGIRTRNWLVLITSDEWAPAWLNWRYGDDYVGWAPLPPDELVESYEVQPAFWMFVPGRYMAPPRVRTYIVPLYRRTVTRVVNRTRPVQGARLAVNPGISPSFVTRVSGAPIATYRVRPRVFAATQGVTGAVQVRREELGGPGVPRGPVGAGARPGIGPPRLGAISVQRTNTVFSRAPQRRRRSRSARTSPASWAHTRHAPHKARHPQYRPRDQHHLSRLALRIGTSTASGSRKEHRCNRILCGRFRRRSSTRDSGKCSHRLNRRRCRNDRCSPFRLRQRRRQVRSPAVAHAPPPAAARAPAPPPPKKPPPKPGEKQEEKKYRNAIQLSRKNDTGRHEGGPLVLKLLPDQCISTFLNCQGSRLSMSSGKRPGRPVRGVQSV
jgi:hypothetical protein